MPRQEHARMQAIPRLIHYQQLELPPCIHQKEGCGAIENSTLPQCPCWTDWEIQGRKKFRVESHMANDCWLPMRYMGGAEWEPKRKSMYWLVELLRGVALRHLLLLVVATTSIVKDH